MTAPRPSSRSAHIQRLQREIREIRLLIGAGSIALIVLMLCTVLKVI
jgi:hypothetical protein